MAIPRVKHHQGQRELVMVEDPDVEPLDAKARGWIPREAATVGEGATVVTIRALNIDERALVLDTKNRNPVHERALARVKLGLAAVDGSTNRKALNLWMDDVDSLVLSLLGIAIDHHTQGRELTDQRDYVVHPDEDEEDERDGASGQKKKEG